MKFTIEQAKAVRAAYVDNVSDTDRHNTLDQDLHDALNTVLGGDQDRLTPDEREYVESFRNTKRTWLDIIDRLAPAPAPRDPVVALLDQWATTAPDHAAALRAALAARGDAE